MDIDQFVKGLTKTISHLNCGDFTVGTVDDNTDSFDDSLPTDTLVYYDFCSDNLSKADEDKLVKFLYDFAWPAIYKHMSAEGYQIVSEKDGSGGGLYYGGVVFRK